MPASIVSAISRAQFEQLAHRGLAGEVPELKTSVASEQWQSEHPDWRGRHWAYTEDEAGVLRLHPLNIARATRQPRAA
ncbi:hypothetical protein K7711_46795 [Nocardia sp. CA2R105]|uniref:hypothetical protein n=1 Tax=Nocardia coffeae TaxID=2873381 RepID=UPI001CA66453|nr:hypothetical protein [Nocardia coffeae]MBY8864041.1 hypothetical protein [Nocardia coffeae]